MATGQATWFPGEISKIPSPSDRIYNWLKNQPGWMAHSHTPPRRIDVSNNTYVEHVADTFTTRTAIFSPEADPDQQTFTISGETDADNRNPYINLNGVLVTVREAQAIAAEIENMANAAGRLRLRNGYN